MMQGGQKIIFGDAGMHVNPNKLTLRRTSLKEILQVIDEMNKFMAIGLDNIPNTAIKDGKDILAPQIRRLVDLSIMKKKSS